MKILNLSYALLLAGALFSCTKLEQRLRSEVSAESSSVTATGLLQSAYEFLNSPYQDQARIWCLNEHTTDECVGPTRAGDWDDNGVWRVLHAHTWAADHGFAAATFSELLQVQFAASSVLTKSPSTQQAAEARFLRALSMFSVLDVWDQVPFRASLTDLKQLPETKKGQACADFIISELEAIINDLPNGPAIKANKNAARALLMKLYLNRGVFANRQSPTFATADMAKVVSLADQITGFSYTTNYYKNFSPDNETASTENIFSLENTNGVRGGNNQSRWYCTLHYNQNPSGWNGFTTLSDFYNKFLITPQDTTDKRLGGPYLTGYYAGVTDVSGLRVGLLVGQQYNQNGVALTDRGGNPLSFTPQVALVESGNNLEVTGIRVIKFPPDYQFNFPARNDMVLLRYADVQLMKAEALLRQGAGNEPAARAIVNALRTARGATSTYSTLTLDNILDERGRELYWEGWRRNDLIRFGKWLQAWQLKSASDAKRLLFPIPSDQLALNPNLTQNPGY
jgi:hypothetical protein